VTKLNKTHFQTKTKLKSFQAQVKQYTTRRFLRQF